MNREAPPAAAGRIVTAVQLPRGISLAGSGPIALTSESRFAISPDGRRLVVAAADSSNRTGLWVRELGSAVFQPLAMKHSALGLGRFKLEDTMR